MQAKTTALNRAQSKTLLQQAGLVVFGSAILAASAWIEVPMIPVPMTMQTLAVILIGAFYGSRLAFVTVAVYLLEGALGLPVFSGGAAGPLVLVGPTAGYLAAFPFAAAFVGWCAEKNFLNQFYSGFGAMIAGHAIIFASGVAWLSGLIGIEAAIAGGFTPFILGTLVKSGLAIAVVMAATRRNA